MIKLEPLVVMIGDKVRVRTQQVEAKSVRVFVMVCCRQAIVNSIFMNFLQIILLYLTLYEDHATL